MRRMALLYVNERVARGEFTKGTADRTWYCLADFADSFGRRPVDQLGRKAVERWLVSHPEWRPGTRYTNFGRVKAFCRWLLDRGVIRKDPFVGLKAPKRPRKNPRPLSRREYDQLRAVLPDARAKLIVGLMYWLGLRCCEVAWLGVEDIDRYGKTIHVTGKGRNERIIPYVPQVELLLNLYLRDNPATTGPLIRSLSNPYMPIQPATVSILVRRWMVLADVKQHAFDGRGAHSWRHTTATEIAEATHDPYAVQELLGHADISTSMYYVRRASTGRLRDALERRETMFV